ncbi:MAG: phage protein GemA/Gp16 family protein [Tepidisphaeraceae bacterium]
MTKNQLILVHQAKRELQQTRGLDDAWYRDVLKIAGGVLSSKELSNAGFERVMGSFEGMGFRDSEQKAGRRSETYWRDCSNRRERFASTQQVHDIQARWQLIKGYTLTGLCKRFSHGRTEQPSKLTPYEAQQLVEMLKAVAVRQQERTAGNEGN